MQSHFIETINGLSKGSQGSMILALVLAGIPTLMVILSVTFPLFYRGQMNKRKARMLTITTLVGIAACFFAFPNVDRVSDAYTADYNKRDQTVSTLVSETLKPAFEEEKATSLKLIPLDSDGGFSPELRLSSKSGEPQFVQTSSRSEFQKMNLEAWALDLAEGNRPAIEIFYQDGTIDLVEAEFNSDGELVLSPVAT